MYSKIWKLNLNLLEKVLMVKVMTSDEDAASLGGQAEVYRRKLVRQEQADTAMINLLKGEVKTMQGQLTKAYKRIQELVTENEALKKKIK